MPGKARVLLLIPHLGGGGAEQVIALLARSLSAEKYDLHLALLTASGTEGTALPANVTVHAIGARRVRTAAPGLLGLIWRIRPAIVLAGMAHVGFLVLLLRPLLPRATRILVRQNGTASAIVASGRVPRYTRLLYRWLFPHAECVVCQSRAMADDLLTITNISPERLVVLPNPIDFAAIESAAVAPSLWSGPGPHLLAVGRLAEEKGFELLLDALKTVRIQHPQADLTIAGEGPLREQLERQALELGLDDAIHLAGHLDRPQRYFPGATLFVLSSRHEGMPNALLEAAAAGMPLVATPASGGLCELLDAMPGAWLAAEVSATALSEAILAALEAIAPGERFHRPGFNRAGSRPVAGEKNVPLEGNR